MKDKKKAADKLRPIVYPDQTGARADRRLLFEGKVDDYLRRLQHKHVHPPAAV